MEKGPHEEAIRRQSFKQGSASKQELMKRRKAIVEPVFGQIKQNDGFRRFTVRGLENVKTQWSLVCSAFDLRKLYRMWVTGKYAPA